MNNTSLNNAPRTARGHASTGKYELTFSDFPNSAKFHFHFRRYDAIGTGSV